MSRKIKQYTTLAKRSWLLNNWRGVWNKALSYFWCNVKFSSSVTTEYKEIWKENLVIYQKSLKAFLQAPLQFQYRLAKSRCQVYYAS